MKVSVYLEKVGKRGKVTFKTYTNKLKLEGEKLYLSLTPILERYAILGSSAKVGWDDTVIPCRIIGKSEKEIILAIPEDILKAEKLRLFITKRSPVVFLKIGNLLRPFEIVDISGYGFTVRAVSYDLIDELIDTAVRFRIILGEEMQQIEGESWLIDVLEESEGKLKMSFGIALDEEEKDKLKEYLRKALKTLLMS
ncbi:MAG: hypothetical protein ABWK04_07875 [Hydrogenobacter sp.]